VGPSPVVEVVGLGPAGVDHVTDHTRRVIATIPRRFLRTSVHPSAEVVTDAETFDDLYESAESFDEVYSEIVRRLVAAARDAGRVLYAVPGSPLVLERTVALLRDEPGVEVVLHPASSFLDLVWSRLGVDPIESTVTLIDGHTFTKSAAGRTGPLLVAHCHANWVLSEIKLAFDDTDEKASNDDVEVVLLHHLGLPTERIVRCRFADIDRTIEADHLTSLYIPRLRSAVAHEMVSFHELARTLRRECPWDREQTHHSLLTYLLEETHEVVDAILALDPDDPATDEHLVEELGDLLYQIEFHAAIAEQEGRFSMADVARGINEKLVRRHPHVFAPDSSTSETFTTDSSGPDSATVLAAWDAIKAAEKAARGDTSSPFDSVPRSSGSLSFASGIVKKAEKNGIDIGIENLDGLGRLDTLDDMGDFLLAVVVECRRRGIDPEVALREAVNRRIG